MLEREDRLSADARARRRALDVGTSFIVQAPAGSGKTELLVQRVLALLPTVTEPEAILAITFTRKAAAEMRERIVGALRLARAPEADVSWQRPETRALALAALAADTRQRWGLLDNPARLRIQTIDALNHMLARRLPVLSGLGAEVEVEDRADQAHWLAAERLLLHLDAGAQTHAQAVRTVLVHLDNRVPSFLRLVSEMLQRREAWLPVLPGVLEDPAARARLRGELAAVRARVSGLALQDLQAQLPAGWLGRLAPLAGRAAGALRPGAKDSPLLACTAGRVPEAQARDLPLWQGLAELLLTKDGKPRALFNVTVGLGNKGAGAQVTEAVQDLLSELTQHPDALAALHDTRELPEADYLDVEWEVLLALCTLLRLAAAELDLVFAERRRIDHPRAALAAQAALGEEGAPSDTALALDARLAHVLVDEFQDTSESQVELLRRLTAGWQPGDGRTLFLVGDPMQSIYRFRDAEVGLFLEVRERGLGDLRLEPLRIAVNFRSTAPIVDWVNRCFGTVLGPHDDELRGQVAFAPSTAAPGAGDAGGVEVHAGLARSPEQEAREIVDVVVRRLEESVKPDPRESGRVAILVRARKHLRAIVPELRARGIPWRASDIDPLGSRPVVRDLRALTAALAHLGDRSAWLAVLHAPWCGLSLAELHALCADDGPRVVMDALRDPGRVVRLADEPRARLARTLPVLERALAEVPRLGLASGVERAWHALGGPSALGEACELAEARSYLDLLSTLENGGEGRIDPEAIDEGLARLYAPPDGPLEARVELMTIHRAKGLQFDTVIVPGLDRHVQQGKPPLLRWTKLPDLRGKSLLVAPLKAIGGRPGALYQWLGRLERARGEHEGRRLLYVAATRAERCLHWFGNLEAGKSRPTPRTALDTLWPLLEPAFRADESVPDAPPVETPLQGGAGAGTQPQLTRLPAHWTLAPPPEPPPLAPPVVAAVAAGEPLVFDWASESARHVGTVVHRELQWLAMQAADGARPLPADRHEQAPRFAQELAELGVPPGQRADAVERVGTALARTLGDSRGRWLLGPQPREAACELALTGRDRGELVSVIIDRSFVAADGVRWIVDYKTSRHEGGDLERFLDQEQERYARQLERYARLLQSLGPQPIRLALYFPVLSAWREWPAPVTDVG